MQAVHRMAILVAFIGVIARYHHVPARLTATHFYLPRPGDRILIEPAAGSRALIRLLNGAQRTIFVETYILTDQPVAHALERAAAQGVDVRVMLDPEALGMGRQPVKEAVLLRAAGIDVRWTSPAFPLTHAKLIVVDDRLAVVSTANFSRSAFTSNREFLIVDQRQAEVRALSDLFRHDWDRLPDQRVTGRLVLSPLNARHVIDGLVSRARRTLDVYAEELQDPTVERLLGRARSRGVVVRILLPPGAQTYAQNQLQRTGVLFCRPHVPYIHAKVVSADDAIAYVGSTNLSTQSLDRNREVGLLETGQSVTVFERVFSADWCDTRFSARRGILHRFRRASERGVDIPVG